ncbi:AfsR/SARP family transcriptional regulator, partial [Kitasatospora sp. NPDC004240]
MEVRVGVLGPMTAEVDGRQVSLGGLRQRAVLAVLVTARGRMVSADALIDHAWESAQTPSPATLHSYVAHLRKALEPGRPARRPARIVVREGTGYALRLPDGAVDAERFTALVAQGQQRLRGGDAVGAAGDLREALALWRGPAYADFTDTDFAGPECARLNGLHLAAYEELFTAELALGRHSAVVGDLEKHTAVHPLSERGWELLALARYRCGRQADALGALRSARRTLAEELGIDPGPALRALEAAVLAQDAELAAPPGPVVAVAPAAPAPVAEPAPPAGFPAVRGPLLGRDEDVAAVRELLRGHRLVTLTGVSGTGKTRLALDAARGHRAADGRWLVELAALRDPALLPETVAAALGLPSAGGTDALAAVLGERDALLVLDTCEHLLDGVAGFAARLLAACPRLRILATSQEAIGLPDEWVHEVGPLSGGPDGGAVALFLDRAARAGG